MVLKGELGLVWVRQDDRMVIDMGEWVCRPVPVSMEFMVKGLGV